MSILSFHCKDTRQLFEGDLPKRFKNIQTVAERKLHMLNSAVALGDLRAPPANRLESLSGDRTGQYSIRINDQWRICFKWTSAGVTDVEIVDYHK